MARQTSGRGPLVADRRPIRGQGSSRGSGPGSRPVPARRRRGPIGWLLGLLAGLLRAVFGAVWAVSWRFGLLAALVIGGWVLWQASLLPPATSLVDGRARGSVTLLDANGQPFAWRGDQFGGMVTADSVSPHLRNAIIATEDRRFWLHPGVDPIGIASAIRINLSEGRGPFSGNGGSTITQQTAKLLCLGRPFDPARWENEAAYEADCRRTTLWRKAEEAIYAMAMELRYSKEEILTLYLNRAYLGAGTRGFEAASRRYFDKGAADLSPAEAAMLAGLLKAPSTFAPTANLARSQDRAALVIGLMEEQGYLTPEEAAEARANPARLAPTAAQPLGGAFADWVMDSGPEFFTSGTTEDVIIRTTLDPRIQRAAEQALRSVFETRVRAGSQAEAAIVVMSADGAVRAMVGGRADGAGRFNRATMALRQTGSAFKPFIYAAALDLGYSPMDIIDDSPLCMTIAGSGQWCPENYDRTFKGPITLTQALAESRNIPAVLLSEQVGRDNVRAIAEGFGLSGDLASGPALALGASESTLLRMTAAYAGILNGGSAVEPYGLVDLTILGDSEPVMGRSGGLRERIIREQAARQLVWMMWRVVEEGTGTRARIPGWELAGKTGTTQGARDAWFIGFSADYVTGVWMGYDDNTPLTGVTGGGLPAEIWRETMVRVLDGLTPRPLPMEGPAGGGTGRFVDPGGLLAEGTGQPFQPTGDPAVDAALEAAFGPPSGSFDGGTPLDPGQEAVLDALISILSGQ
ncbi:penicillin-binding protein, 1A family [Rubellimicrobium thermophilum DSM 16684]|uniref:peptidoglycan glycosyltransferase n=1 Tax=Rubellimicrobium thermophilum DSM 16684 TaxID=1123069 RepID=S9QU27_9RHOB|nr:PBP1A family penicillin-binding protein [Rubellimicrobium thermophilum]EPX84896.1 penicillin-binding protein, 1A family [Rubellimicrobium thermophilum DSM 16684]